jgi:hypothetical protein
VTWGPNGGRVAYVDSSTLSPCRTFEHQRTSSGGTTISACVQELAVVCAGVIGAADVDHALAHPDVAAAIAAAPVVYGDDPRAFDGSLLRLLFAGNVVVDVGTRCTTTTCTPIPAGIEALAALLRALTAQELARETCRAAFPPPP